MTSAHTRLIKIPNPSPAVRTFSSAVERWASVGPYYAMFPVSFAFEVVRRYSAKGSAVLDPFAGRATSIYAAAASGRSGVGIELNPVGWLYGRVKMRPASKQHVLDRLQDLVSASEADRTLENRVCALPPFFHAAYCQRVLRFLETARGTLAWKKSKVDATVMAFIVIYLHGKRSAALSNQMRDGKSMAPDYAVRWWTERRLAPPEVDPHAFLKQRIEWRYRHGAPELDGSVWLGDSTTVLKALLRRIESGSQRRFGLLFTSPPYLGVTNYHYDQWLRLWVLGGSSHPHESDLPRGRWQRKFESKVDYRALLEEVFSLSAESLTSNATVYVRTDAREFTRVTTVEILRSVFPRKRLVTVGRPLVRKTQTALFGDRSDKPGEVDLILTP
jgi:hypothetical protein